MIKRFCDVCSREVPQSANRTVFTYTCPEDRGKAVNVSVEIMVSIDGTANAVDICLRCVKEVVEHGTPTAKVVR